MATDSRIPEKAHNMEDRKEYGAALAKIAVDALPTMEGVPCDGIQITQENMSYPYKRHQNAEQYKAAKEVMDLFKAYGATVATARAKELGLINKAHAQDLVNHYGDPKNGVMELDAFRIGEVAFATAPWEMFSDTSAWIKDNSPYKYTMVLSIANGRSGYMATREAFEYVSYESVSSNFGPGGAETAAEHLVNMLKGFQQ